MPSGVWSTVTDQAPGKAPDAMPAKRPWADVAAYSSPLIESVDVVAAIAAAGPVSSAAEAARTGIIHPCQRMTYRTSSRPVGRTPRASSVLKACGLAQVAETASPVPCRHGQGTAGGSSRATQGRRPGCLAAGPGAARVRRWWQVARLPRAPGPPDVARRPGGRRLPLSPPWPGRGRRPGTGGPLRGTGQGPAAIWREWPVRAWAVRLGLMSDRAVTGAGLSGTRFPPVTKGPGIQRAAPGAAGAVAMAVGSGALGGQSPAAGSR